MRALVFALAIFMTLSVTAQADDTVYVCDDIKPWPPFTYPEAQGKAKSEHGRTGAMIDLLDEVMKEAGLSYEIKLKPWLRCLKEIGGYSKPGQAEIMMGVNYNEERAAIAHFSVPIFKTQRAIFYAQNAFPNGVDWKTPADTASYTVCVVKGFDYSDVIVSDQGPVFETSSLEVALKQVKRGRCQLLFNSIASAVGSKLYGKSIIPDGVTYQEYSTSKINNYHMMISRKSPRADVLLEKLNSAIERLTENGERNRIFSKYYKLMKQ